MTELHRTPLTTSQKVEFAALALAGQDSHGTVSALSREYAISRPTVYQAREAAVQVLTEPFTQEDGGGARYAWRSTRRNCIERWWHCGRWRRTRFARLRGCCR